MIRHTIKTNYLETIDWLNGKIIDWCSAGEEYSLDGQKHQRAKYHYGSFDGSITSPDGQYSFVYKRLGTKGLLLKNGEILREINRSYYCAESYEYPAAFVVWDYVTYLIHCPIKYCQLDFENVETLPFKVMKTDDRDSDGTTYKMDKNSSFRFGKGGKIFKFETLNGNVYIKKQS